MGMSENFPVQMLKVEDCPLVKKVMTEDYWSVLKIILEYYSLVQKAMSEDC